MLYRKKSTSLVEAVQQDAPFEVETLEGVMRGKAGDYLVTSLDGGESWPVARERFEATYEPAEELARSVL